MNPSIQRIELTLERMNIVFYVGAFVILKIGWTAFSHHVYLVLTDKPIVSGVFEIANVYYTFILVIIVGPLFETYISQYLFFKYLLGQIHHWKIVVLSAFVFALFHWYNIGYVVYAFVSGLLLSTSYALRLRSNPFVCTVAIHSVYNLFVFFYNRWD